MKRSASAIGKHRVGELAQLARRPHRLARDEQRRCNLEVAALGGTIEEECGERARERAPAPRKKAKRLPESFAARAKSRMPSRSPSSQCGSGAKSKRRAVRPNDRTSTFADLVGAIGNRVVEKVGHVLEQRAQWGIARSTARARALFLRIVDRSRELRDLGAQLARGGRPCPLPSPISAESRFFSAFARSTAVSAERYSSS